MHQKERPPKQSIGTVYKCDYCVFDTTIEGQYKRHITRFHTDSSELIIKCDFEGCPKMLKAKRSNETY